MVSGATRAFTAGAAQRFAAWPCYHTDLYTFTLADQTVGIVGCAVGAHAEATELTMANFESAREGKHAFVKFLAPWYATPLLRAAPVSLRSPARFDCPHG